MRRLVREEGGANKCPARENLPNDGPPLVSKRKFERILNGKEKKGKEQRSEKNNRGREKR